MKVDGRCLCGFITFAAEIDPEKVLVCHCTDCQTLSSSAFRVTVRTEEEAFKLLSGKLKTFVKTAESGNRRVLAFCPRCGTSIYSAPDGQSAQDRFFGLRVGALLQRDHLPPKEQYWMRSRQQWAADMSALKAFEKE